MAHPEPYDRDKLDRELQDMILEDAPAVTHALWCELCGARDIALTAIGLAGWTEVEYLEALARRAGRRA
jgi:hypothetical protein